MLFFAVVYVVEGIGQAKVGIIWQPLNHYLKEVFGWTPVQISVSLAVLDLPWIIKPIYGLISDFIPLFGYRRRAYLLLANVAAVAAYAWVTVTDAPTRLVFALTLTSFAMAIASTLVRRAAGGERPAPPRQRRVRHPAMALVQRRDHGDGGARRPAHRIPVAARRDARRRRDRRRGTDLGGRRRAAAGRRGAVADRRRGAAPHLATLSPRRCARAACT